MKKIIGIITILLLVQSSFGQSNTGLKKFYALHHFDDNVQHITIPKLFLQIAADDPDAKAILKYMRSLKIFQIEKLDDQRESICNELQTALKQDGFESILEVNDSGERVNIYILQDERYIRKFLITVDSKQELVMLQTKTKISFDHLGELLASIQSGKSSSGLKKMIGFKG